MQKCCIQKQKTWAVRHVVGNAVPIVNGQPFLKVVYIEHNVCSLSHTFYFNLFIYFFFYREREKRRKWQNIYSFILTWNEKKMYKVYFKNTPYCLTPFRGFWNCQHSVKTTVISVIILPGCDVENAVLIFLYCFNISSLEKVMVCCNSIVNWLELPDLWDSHVWITFSVFTQTDGHFGKSRWCPVR